MLVSYNWLQEYVDVKDFTAKEIAEKLTRGGVEVDIVHSLNKGMKGVVVGHVLECEQHPNADKLKVCQVDIGEEEAVQIVCGAPNVGKGQKVAVATVGAVLPNNFKIKKAKLRGEVSQGMICSLQELGIEGKLVPREFSEGIFQFSSDVPVGVDALEQLNLNDEILELDLTPNRADCLSMLGVAYEIGALLDREVKLPSLATTGSKEQASDYISVKVDAPEANPYYGAKIIKGVKIAPSPRWLQNRLMAAGIRPISNVVDVTNYVLIEYGQPLHAFDYDRFGSKEVVVRYAKEKEEIITLDDEERKLRSHHLAITNGIEPTAVAGVMGGAKSEVQDDTTTILLEAAYFDPTTVRRTSRELGLRSEASLRYEKGIDPNRVRDAADRAANLIAELAGGEVLAGTVEVDTQTIEERNISITLERINRSLGTTLTVEQVQAIFRQLQFEVVVEGATFHITAPTRRADLVIEEDLIEEVARLYGYDNIPTTLPIGVTTQGGLSERQKKQRKVRRYLEKVGLSQTITYSLTSAKLAESYATENGNFSTIRLAMPMSDERSTLRTSLLPHLYDVLQYNLNRNVENIAVYEMGSIFLTEEKELTKQPEEREMIAAAITGKWVYHPWQAEEKDVDFYVVKGVLEGLFAELKIAAKITFKQGKKQGLHPGRTASIYAGEEEIGFIGQVHPTLQKQLDLDETYVFQLDAEKLFAIEEKTTVYERLPRFPAIHRDIAIVVKEDIAAAQVQHLIETEGGKLLKSVHLFDVYQGEHLEAGRKSLAFSLTYYDPERTLKDEEVTEVHDKIVVALERDLGATLRS